MQRENASACEVGDWEVVDPAFDAPDEPPHAAASGTRPAAAMIATMRRATGARPGGRMTQLLAFIMLRSASHPFLCSP
jgi:hypothetical protein